MATARRGARTRGRTQRRRRAAAAGVGVACAAAGLVAAAVLLPVDLSGAPAAVAPAAATVQGPSTAITVGGTGSVAGSGEGSLTMPVPVPVGPVLPSFVVPRPVTVPVYVPPFVPRGVSPRLRPPPARCGGYATPRRIVPGVTPGTGSASVNWRADDSSDVEGYRIQAVSQHLVGGPQPAPVQVTVAQQAGCAPMTATVPGLASGSYYVFWLEEAQRDKTSGLLRYVQVGTSDAVLIG